MGKTDNKHGTPFSADDIVLLRACRASNETARLITTVVAQDDTITRLQAAIVAINAHLDGLERLATYGYPQIEVTAIVASLRSAAQAAALKRETPPNP